MEAAGLRLLLTPFDTYLQWVRWNQHPFNTANGGAGGGMRWPNRSPHRLTPGIRRAQAALAGFLPHID